MARRAKPWFRAGRGWYSTLDGKQTPLNVFDPDKIEDARDALAKLLAALPSNQVSTTHAPHVPAPVDWAAKADEWIARKSAQKLKRKTLKEYRWNLGKWLAKFGTIPREAITFDRIEEHSHSFGWGTNQRRHYIRTATGFLAWCGVKFEEIRCPGHQSAGAESVIPEDRHKRAVELAPGDTKQILCFLWHTGCRPCEACDLTGECVDWNAGVVKLREHKTAGKGILRMLYLAPPALAILTAQRAKYGPTGPVFRTKHDRAYLRTGVTATMGRISKRLGERITAYGYRHTYATRALEKGIPDTHVAALLGHTSTKMIHAHYSHISANARLLREVAAKVG